MSVATRLPSSTFADSTQSQFPSRTLRFGEAGVVQYGFGMVGTAQEGSLFVATNATLATGIAGHAAPVVADTDTKPFLHLFNVATNTKDIIPLYLLLEVTAAGTAGTIQYAVQYIEGTGGVTLRASGGTQLTPVNACTSVANTTGATVYAGAVVATTSANNRKVGQQIIREVIPVVQDTIAVDWTGGSNLFHSALTTAGTATNHTYLAMPSVCITPGGNFNFSMIRPSQSAAASYQIQFAYLER